MQPLPRILKSVNEVTSEDQIKLLARQFILLVAVSLVGLQVFHTLVRDFYYQLTIGGILKSYSYPLFVTKARTQQTFSVFLASIMSTKPCE